MLEARTRTRVDRARGAILTLAHSTTGANQLSPSATKKYSSASAPPFTFLGDRVYKFLFAAVLLAAAPTEAVTCAHCKMTIAGCGGTDVCPLITDHGANIAAFESETLDRAPQVTNLLPPRLLCIFSRSVCECLVGVPHNRRARV